MGLICLIYLIYLSDLSIYLSIYLFFYLRYPVV
jgi:hypothetical protein